MKQSDLLTPPIPPQPGQRLFWGNLQEGALPFAVANAASQLDAPLIFITHNTQSANRFARELAICLPPDQAVPVLHFPDWETLPYDHFSPHQDIISDRLTALSKIGTLSKGILVVALPTLLNRLAPRTYVDAHSLTLTTGDTLEWDTLRLRLIEAGYQSVSQVLSHGEFALRGSIIDIFPMGQSRPIRIDLFGKEIDSLRFFSPDTQRSDTQIPAVQCLPAREFPLTADAIATFRQQWRSHFEGDPLHCPLYQATSQGIASAGIEYYLPLFFEKTSTLFDYLPANALIIRPVDCEPLSEAYWQEVRTRYEQYRHDRLRPLLPPADIFLPTESLFAHLNAFRQVCVQQAPFENAPPASGKFNFDTLAFPDLTVDLCRDNPLGKLTHFIQDHPSAKILLCAETAGRRESLVALLGRNGLHPRVFPDPDTFFKADSPFGITIAPLDAGLWIGDKNTLWIVESQLFSHQIMQRRRRQKTGFSEDQAVRDLSELVIGDPLVHIDHGVGRYQGLTHLSVAGIQAEYMILEYADRDKLYIPVSNLHCINRYSGGGSSAPLHKLGSDHWDKAKKKAEQKAHDVAVELLEIYAKRALKQGHRFAAPDDQYYHFANSFRFEETPDQAKAIEAVIADLASDKPMDRLVCGDVGFGKTEVAVRAAFIAVQDNKQVVILVPTTLLAQQHFETFSDRFADWPVKIQVISRFKSAKEQSKIIEELSEGKVDIIIGTHSLLSEKIHFKQLGLVIIDEEHRFGVRQKERMKALRQEVDILTLTATPIPRTLNMAFANLRDLSIIASPPAKRLSVKTFVCEHNAPLIQEAILREIMRGGQVYYLHNDVETIEKTAQAIQESLPQARVNIAHGQMRERQLEQIMSDFYHQRFNVLVCTTIIETGIDIPTANTIIMDRADKLGLAQLHQLRGRVGRSHHQAYAYCLTPGPKKMTPDAVKRLEALGMLEELGAGFTLATQDLEIRGAGELLGEDQSGNINAVGFSLYMELLERAVASLRSGNQTLMNTPLRQSIDINLDLSALIPETYLPDVHSRLILYKRIANAKNKSALEELQVEMIDRFGLLPDAAKNLFTVTEFKLKAQSLGILKIEANSKGGKLAFDTTPNVNPDKIIAMVRNKPQHFKLSGSQEIKFMFDMPTPEIRFQVVGELLNNLAG